MGPGLAFFFPRFEVEEEGATLAKDPTQALFDPERILQVELELTPGETHEARTVFSGPTFWPVRSRRPIGRL